MILNIFTIGKMGYCNDIFSIFPIRNMGYYYYYERRMGYYDKRKINVIHLAPVAVFPDGSM